MLKTERKLVNLGQGAKNVFYLGFKSICVVLASTHLKTKNTPKCWNNWRKVVFAGFGKFPLPFSICNRKETIYSPVPEGCPLGDKQILMDCFAGVFPVTLGACPSKQPCNAVCGDCEAGDGKGCRKLCCGPVQWLKMTSAGCCILIHIIRIDRAGFKSQVFSPAEMEACQLGITWWGSSEQ